MTLGVQALWPIRPELIPVSIALKELRPDKLSHFFDGLNCGLSVGKPKNNGLLRKKNNRGLLLKQNGTRMVEDGGD